MIKVAFLATLSCSAIFTDHLSAQAPVAPQEKAEVEASALHLSLDAFTDMKNIFKIAGTANNIENTNKAVVAIKGLIAKFPARIKSINAAQAPSKEERKQWAINMLDTQEEMQAAVKTMNDTLNTADKDVQKLMAPVMQSFFLNVKPLVSAIEKHFPDEERNKLEQEEKERRKKAANEKSKTESSGTEK